MDTYLYDQLGRIHRRQLIDEAAADHLARSARARSSDAAETHSRGRWGDVRRTLDGDGEPMSFLPRLSGYPTAR